MSRSARRTVFGIVSSAALVLTLVAGPAGAQRTGGQRPAENTDQQHPAGVFAFNFHYVHPGDAPDTVTIHQGDHLSFGNYDPLFGVAAHSLTEIVPDCTAPPHTGNGPSSPNGCGYPRFSSGLVDHGYVHRVAGVESLKPGTYKFNCQVHAFMVGTLVVA
jgi:plastocyanin